MVSVASQTYNDDHKVSVASQIYNDDHNYGQCGITGI